MQKTSKFLQGFRKDLALFSLVFVFICIISCSLVTVLPSVDRAVCYHQLSQKLGITNNYQDLRKHIGESLKTGMNRADAKSALQSFGPVSVLPDEQIIDHQITDQIGLKICLHPFNNPVIYLHYDLNGELVSWEFENPDN